MITTGSKYFFGLAAFALVAAFVYGGATAGHQIDMATLVGVISLGYKGTVGDLFGYSVLITLFGASLFLGCATSAFRDADPEAAAQFLELETVPEVTPPQGASYWPVLAAFGVTSAVIGFVVGAPLVILGVGVLVICAFEWSAKAWSERATGDPAVNRAIRNRMLLPIEIPLLGLVGIAVFVLSISRILLALPQLGTYLVFGIVPAVILFLGWLITSGPKVNRNLLTVVFIVLGIAVLAGGVVAATAGPRKEKHQSGIAVHQVVPAPASATNAGHPA